MADGASLGFDGAHGGPLHDPHTRAYSAVARLITHLTGCDVEAIQLTDDARDFQRRGPTAQ